jgi:hypothetical protein
MEFQEVWGLAKDAIIPLIGLIWFLFKQKIDKFGLAAIAIYIAIMAAWLAVDKDQKRSR